MSDMTISYRFATSADADTLLQLRLTVLRDVNELPEDHCFPEAFVEASRRFFTSGDHVTAVAEADGVMVGCATLCPLHLMPTFSHPTGHRGHIMNVYTAPACRRQGIARQLMTMLMDHARAAGMTELSLDATDAGQALYTALGFAANEEGMVLTLPMNA